MVIHQLESDGMFDLLLALWGRWGRAGKHIFAAAFQSNIEMFNLTDEDPKRVTPPFQFPVYFSKL